ncbi:hypothetical protein [Mariniluteicoccus endophyticus]
MNRVLLIAGATVGLVVTLMVRQTSKAQNEADLWALATEPRR